MPSTEEALVNKTCVVLVVLVPRKLFGKTDKYTCNCTSE